MTKTQIQEYLGKNFPGLGIQSTGRIGWGTGEWGNTVAWVSFSSGGAAKELGDITSSEARPFSQGRLKEAILKGRDKRLAELKAAVSMLEGF